jgi:hypothetical protein
MGVMLETVSLAVSCTCCGGSHIEFRGAPRDDTEVVCLECGSSLGDWAEVKEQARAAMADALRDDFHQVVADALARRTGRTAPKQHQAQHHALAA